MRISSFSWCFWRLQSCCQWTCLEKQIQFFRRDGEPSRMKLFLEKKSLQICNYAHKHNQTCSRYRLCAFDTIKKVMGGLPSKLYDGPCDFSSIPCWDRTFGSGLGLIICKYISFKYFSNLMLVLFPFSRRRFFNISPCNFELGNLRDLDSDLSFDRR